MQALSYCTVFVFKNASHANPTINLDAIISFQIAKQQIEMNQSMNAEGISTRQTLEFMSKSFVSSQAAVGKASTNIVLRKTTLRSDYPFPDLEAQPEQIHHLFSEVSVS